MRIIDALKKILGIKPNQEQLYLPVSQENYETSKFRQNCRIQQQLQNNPKEPTLEECMDEFIKQYSLQEQINSEHPNKSYNAFRRMFCDKEEDIRT